MDRPHVVIVGAGFGGLTAAQELEGAPVRVTVIDRRNHHLFQPLLYQVAMAGLSPADIASPTRSILAHQENVRVLLEEVTAIDLANKTITTDVETHAYDWLVLATGAKTDYFGHPEWEAHAPGLKSLEDAIEIRRRVLLAFEMAEREPSRSKELLTFVVIGGGPTGVELAGAVAELARHVLGNDFRTIVPKAARVVLLEGGARILEAFPQDLSESAKHQLEELGVEVKTGKRVTSIDEHGVSIGEDRIVSGTVLWAAGVKTTGVAQMVGAHGAPLDRGGRVIVEPDVSVPGHPEVFAIGDMSAFLHTKDKKALPGVSPVAMQQARFVTKIIKAGKKKPASDRGTFEYFDKGTMATIGRSRAIAWARGMKMSGFLAWLAWLTVHLWFLVGFRNRVAVMLSWAWSYFTYRRGARLITGRVGKPEPLPPPG
jgi:NADH dehydrogenase